MNHNNSPKSADNMSHRANLPICLKYINFAAKS